MVVLNNLVLVIARPKFIYEQEYLAHLDPAILSYYTHIFPLTY